MRRVPDHRDPKPRAQKFVRRGLLPKVKNTVLSAMDTIEGTNRPGLNMYELGQEDIRALKGIKGRKPKIRSTVKPSWTRGKDPQPPRKPQPMVDWRTVKKAKPSGRIDDADYHPENYRKR